ncbi:hypothetical protein JQ615_36765 [Bradyrhizobium jicamae]|uniref:Uncharacterized protein n=1 Tax=Bradyrhizobium jicamae TaxID=280332 RepID=A0ABS5FVR4_9BRAD|nr:hypothetical protein [Bradyrhizobium jicamae]
MSNDVVSLNYFSRCAGWACVIRRFSGLGQIDEAGLARHGFRDAIG